MEPARFDQFTKTLAGSTSRRQALKAIAVGTVGGVLGWRATGTAYAAGGNSACAHFCAAVFGANTPAAGQCTSDAAHGTGLCYTCGPASAGGGVAPAAICCTHTSSGYCASYPGATCCTTGQTCQNGTCVTPVTTTTPAPCLSGQTVCSGVCVNLFTDSNNCGACGHVCQDGTTCNGGGLCSCPPNSAICGSATTCTDLLTDSNNCGFCGNVCQNGTTCSGGCCGGNCV